MMSVACGEGGGADHMVMPNLYNNPLSFFSLFLHQGRKWMVRQNPQIPLDVIQRGVMSCSLD